MFINVKLIANEANTYAVFVSKLINTKLKLFTHFENYVTRKSTLEGNRRKCIYYKRYYVYLSRKQE